MKHKNQLYLAVILILAFALRVRSMLSRDLSGDEALFLIRTYTQQPPVGTGLWHVFNKLGLVLGIDPRYFTISIGVFGIFLIYLIGKEISNQRFGLILAAFASIIPAHIFVTASAYLDNLIMLFLSVMTYLFIKYEATNEPRRRQYLEIAICVTALIGTFVKVQAFVFLVGPFFLYGLLKYRFRIFKESLYWMMGLSVLPILVYLVANPEMASTILLFFDEAYKTTIIQRFFNYFAAAYRMDGIFLLIAGISLAYTAALYRRFKKGYKQVSGFFLIFTAFFMAFMIKSNPRYYYMIFTSLPSAFFMATALNSFRKKKSLKYTSYGIICVLLLFTVNSVFSITTGFGSQQMMDAYERSQRNIFFSHMDEVDRFLQGEKYVLAGGNIGMDARYHIHQRLIWPSVMNSNTYDQVNKGIIFYPIDTNYMGDPAWDYKYLQQIINSSEVVKEFTDADGMPVILIEIKNHTRLSDDEFETASLQALSYLEGKV